MRYKSCFSMVCIFWLICCAAEDKITMLQENNGLPDQILRVPAPVTTSVTLNVSMETGTNVQISVTQQNTSLSLIYFSRSPETSNLFNLSETAFQSVGFYGVQVNAINSVSNQTLYEAIAVQHIITINDLVIAQSTKTPIYVQTNLPFTVALTHSLGENLVYSIEIVDDNSTSVLIDSIGDVCLLDSLTTYTATYSVPVSGVFYLLVQASNFLNDIRKFTQINSWYNVNGLKVTLDRNVSLISMPVTFLVSVQNTTDLKLGMGNVTCVINYGDGTSDGVLNLNLSETSFNRLLTTSGNVTHTYSKAGWFYANVFCSNDLPHAILNVSSSQTVNTTVAFTFTILIEYAVVNLVLSHNSSNTTYVKYSTPLELTANTTSPLSPIYVTCIFNYQNNTATVDTKTAYGQMPLKVVFVCADGENWYNVNVNCSNNLTSQALSTLVYVYYDCWMHENFFDATYKNPATPLASKTNDPVELKADVAFTTVCSGPVVTTWTVKKVYAVTETRLIVNTSTPKTPFSIPANTLGASLYKVEVTTSFSSYRQPPFRTDFLYLNYNYPELIVVISNGLTRKIKVDSSVVIDASLSRDPAEELVELNNVNKRFSWACFTGASLNENDVLMYFMTAVLPASHTNCSSLIPSAGVDIKTFNPGTFASDRWYIFIVAFSRGARNAIASQAIYASQLDPIELEITCLTNCYKGVTLDKLVPADLNLNVAILTTAIDKSSSTFYWTLKQYVAGGFIDVTDQLVRNGTGFTVPKDRLVNIDSSLSTKFLVSCTVTAASGSGFAPSSAYKQYITNLAPYGGTCSISGLTNKNSAKAGVTVVCYECSGWMDEDMAEQRNPKSDQGGYLKYEAMQQFLKTDQVTVNDTIPAVTFGKSSNIKNCFKLANIPTPNVTNTLLVIRIADPMQEPYASVEFLIEVVPPIQSDAHGEDGAQQVDTLYNASRSDMESYLKLNDAQKITSFSSVLFSCLHVEVQEEPPIISPKIDVNNGGINDVGGNGTAVSAEEALSGLRMASLDPTTLRIQETNLRIAGSLQTAINNKDSAKASDPDTNKKFIGALIRLSDGPKQNVADNTLGIVGDIVHNVIGSMHDMNVDNPQTAEFHKDMNYAMNSIASMIVPNQMALQKPVADLAAARNYLSNLQLFANDTNKKEQAEMSEDERNYVFAKTQEEIRYFTQNRISEALNHSRKKEMFEDNLLNSTKLADGASKIIGDDANSPATIVLTTDTSDKLATNPINSPTSTIRLPGLAALGQVKVKLAISEMNTVLNIDEAGRSAQVTSKQKRLIIDTEGELPNENIIITHKLPNTTFEHVPAFQYPEDASGFSSYHIVLVDSADDIISFVVRPTEATVEKYKVYITFWGFVSKLNYVAVGECKDPDWLVQFQPSTRPGRETGAWKVGIETIFKSSTSSATRTRREATNVTGEMPSFQLATATMACLDWDDQTKSWRSDTCTGNWNPALGTLHCSCMPKKQMTFANSFYVPPNKIDFSTVFLKFSPLNQAAVIATLSLIFVIYILVVLWARIQDRNDVLKWGITPLADNFCHDNYFYVIKVFTGMRPGAGTRSRVSFVVAGDEMDTGVRELYDGVRKEFTTGSVMNFLMSTPMHLGDLEYIYIWHDNSGLGNTASWYLSKVEIEDVQRNEMFVFLGNRWLGIEKEDGALQCVLPVCKGENLNLFTQRLFSNAKKSLSENHMWISVVYRPQSSNFTRVQRVSCALMFVMLTMISNAVYFRSSNTENYETPAQVQLGPFRFSLQQVYVSFICAAIVTPATILVINFFKMSKTKQDGKRPLLQVNSRKNSKRYEVSPITSWIPRKQKDSIELEKHLVQRGIPKLEGFSLSYRCAHIAWLLVAVATLLCAYFIMLYSMQWGKQKSEEWLITFFMSFFQSVVCLEPIKVGVMSLVMSLLVRSMQTPKADFDRNTILKGYNSYLRGQCTASGTRRKTSPLDGTLLEEARKVRKREIEMKITLRGVLLNLLCIWILYSIGYSNRDALSYYTHQDVIGTFLTTTQPQQTAFTKIITIKDYFDWLRDIAIINTFPETDITGNHLQWRERQYINDGNNVRVGPPRLRQLRTTKEHCSIPYVGKVDCFKQYHDTKEDTKSYCIGWKEEPCDSTESVYKLSPDAWKFTSAFDIWGFPLSGNYTTYGGGGYIAKLSVNRNVSRDFVNELFVNSWIDRQTRAVFYELNLYNPNTNIFTYNVFLAEFPETGSVFTYSMIYPMRLYQHSGALGSYIIACESIFAVYVFVFTIVIVLGIVQQKKAFFQKGWQVFDLIFVVLAYVAIAMYFVQLVFLNKTMKVFRSDKKEFVNFYHIALWNSMYVLLLGILMFMSTLRFLNVLGYNKRIQTIVNVFNKASGKLVQCGMVFLSVFTCYSALGYLLFGSILRAYRNMFEAIGTQFICMIGKNYFIEMQDVDTVLGNVYFLSFVAIVVYMLLSMFLAVLCDAINEVNKESKTDKSEGLFDYVLQKIETLLPYGSGKKKSAVESTSNTPMNGCQKEQIQRSDSLVVLDSLHDLHLLLQDMSAEHRDPVTTTGGRHVV